MSLTTVGRLRAEQIRALNAATNPDSTNPFITDSVMDTALAAEATLRQGGDATLQADIDDIEATLVAAGGLAPTTLASGATGGATSIVVASASGFVVGSYITILLDSGAIHNTTVTAIVSTTLTLAVALPSAAASGKHVSQVPAEVALARDAINRSGSLTLAQALDYAAFDVFNVLAYGALGDGTTDDATAIQAALTAGAAATKSIILFPAGKTYKISTSLTLPKDLSGFMVLSGYGATIKLTSAAPRFLTFNRSADDETFKNFLVQGFDVDADNTTGKHHVVIGSFVSNATLQRINIERIIIRDIRAYNIPVDSTTATSHRAGIWLGSYHTASGQGLNTIKDILIENVRLEGGNYGIFVGAAGPSGSGVNIKLDNIHIRRCYHSLLAVQTTVFSSANFHVGSRGYGGRVTITDCEGYYSGDVGIEVNAFTDALVDGCVIEDAANVAFFHASYQTTLGAQAQRTVFRNCEARRADLVIAGTVNGIGYQVDDPDAREVGTVIYDGCSWYNTAATRKSAYGDAFHVSCNVRRIAIKNFRYVVSGMNSGVAESYAMYFDLRGSPSVLEIDGLDIYLAGTDSSAGSLLWVGVFVIGTNVVLDLDRMTSRVSITGVGAQKTRQVELGRSTTALRGRIRRLAPLSTNDTQPRGAVLRGTGTLTLDRLHIEACDFSQLTGGADVQFVTGDENKDKTHIRHCRRLSAASIGAPTPSGSPYDYRNLDSHPVAVYVSGGTVSAIQVSADGSTWHPTGITAGEVLLPHTHYVRITYSVAPNVRVAPFNPE